MYSTTKPWTWDLGLSVETLLAQAALEEQYETVMWCDAVYHITQSED